MRIYDNWLKVLFQTIQERPLTLTFYLKLISVTSHLLQVILFALNNCRFFLALTQDSIAIFLIIDSNIISQYFFFSKQQLLPKKYFNWSNDMTPSSIHCP